MRLNLRHLRFQRFSLPILLVALLATTTLACALDPQRALTQYGRQLWQTDNGLPQNTVPAIAQTPDGYLWLATDDGLVRFNGIDLKTFNTANTPQLATNSIHGLTVDRTGTLWIATPHGLLADRAGAFTAVVGLPDPTVWFVHEDSKGRLWVATANGLCLLQATHCAVIPATAGLSISTEAKFAEDPAGAIWLANADTTIQLDPVTLGKRATLTTHAAAEILTQRFDRSSHLLVGTRTGLQILRGIRFEPVPIAALSEVQPSQSFEVRAILPAADGTTWLATSNGLAHGDKAFVYLQPASPAVTTLFQDREGAIWAGLEHGLARIADNRLQSFARADPLSASTLLATFEDREGNLWLGTESDGLAMLHEQKFTTLTTTDGLSGNVVRSVLEDAAGTLWIGTDGAGLNRKTSTGFTTLTTVATPANPVTLSSDTILSLAAAPNGDLWIGTPAGLNRLRNGAVKVFTTADGLADDFIRSLLIDRAGNIWVGTRHGLTKLSSTNKPATYTALDGLGSDFIGVMVQSRDDDLWIGTSGGLTRLRDGSFHNFTTRDGLADNAVTAILEDGSGTLWLGSNANGLSRMSNGHILPVHGASLPQTVFGILEDATHHLWIGSRSGIYRVSPTDLDHPVIYGTTDGMRIRECSSGGHPAAIRLHDGTMAFATLRGISLVDPEHLHENRIAPLITLETVLVNDQPHDGTAALTLPPGSQRVEFRYAGLSYTDPQKVQYRYKLEGFDRDWIDAGTHRAAFYTNLRPGHYTFHVQAANNDGLWAKSDATFSLRILPFFYQAPWFYALVALALAALAYLAYAWRVRRVKALYQHTMDERNRIAREIHDTLAQDIVSISLQLEVAIRQLNTAPDTARIQLERTRLLVRQSLDDARASIWELRSHGDDEELPVRMGGDLKRLTESSGIASKLKVTGTYRALSRTIEDELVRILQEAVTNAVHHAECKQIEVELAYSMKALRLVIADDGHGFDITTAPPAGHFGLQGMRERATKIHAELQIVSATGQGAQIAIQLPLV